MSGPFLFREAKLPAGYPPPGPVGRIVIKTYPASRMATVWSSDLAGASQNAMFRPLFNHIKREKIAMTAPVVMTYDMPVFNGEQPRPEWMAFVYADTTIGRTGADAGSPVQVVDLPAISVASIGVRGSYSDARFKHAVERLDRWLAAHGSEYERADAAPRYLAYNSPLVPWFLRYGEVQLPIVARGGN